MTRATNTAETGLADGTAVTTANSDDGAAGTALLAVVTSGGPVTYSDVDPLEGALCFRHVVGTSGNAVIRFAVPGTSATTMALRGYFQIEAEAFSGNNTIMRLLNASNAQMAGLRLTSGMVPQFTNGANAVVGSPGAALSVGTWYRVEAWVTPGTTTSTGRISLDLYAGHDATSLLHYDTTAGNAGTALTPRSLEFGRNTTAAGSFTILSDALAADDGIGETYIGPLADLAIGGEATSTSDASGTISAQRPLDGTAASTSAASGTISARRPLSGTAASTSSASGNIDVASPAIGGTAASTSAASGAISARRPVTGTAASVSDASGTISARRPLAGVAASVSDASGTILARRSLAGTTVAVSSASGVIATLGATTKTYYRGARVARAYHLGDEVALR